MRILESKLEKISLKAEYLFVFLPFVFILGDSFIASVFVLAVFLFLIKDKIFFENGNFAFDNNISWFSLLSWGVFVLFKTPHISTGFYYFFGVIFAPFLLFLIIQNITNNLRYIYIFFICLFVSGIVLGLFSFYNLYMIDFNFSKRIGSLWADMNILSAYYLILFMFCLTFIINKVNDKARVFHYITLFILGMAIFLTQTRGVWMALIFSLTIFFVKKPKVYIISSIFIGLIVLVFSDIIITRYLTVKNFGSDLSSLGRLQAWIATIALVKDNLFLGYWFDSFMDLRDNIYSIYLVPVIHSHNTYLRSLLEIGLIGSVFYFGFFFRALFLSIRLKKIVRNNFESALLEGLQLTFMSLLVVFFFEPYFSLFGCSTLMIWLMIALAFKMKNIIAYNYEDKSIVFML